MGKTGADELVISAMMKTITQVTSRATVEEESESCKFKEMRNGNQWEE